jgi:hypothetical protein
MILPCNLAILEQLNQNYDVASKQEVWAKAMSNEIKMIERNNT